MLVIGATLVALAVAWHSMRTIPLDAIPDLSDTQVIVSANWDQSADIIEDQVTYPITSALLGAPRVKAIRGFSDYGTSFVYVIFEDGTDLYWARSRVLEYLSKINATLPPGVSVSLGPDATSVGWVFQYALVDRHGKQSTDALRSYQDWFLRYAIQSVPGVAEVATVGGQVRQYQVRVDPDALAAFGLPLQAVSDAIRKGNKDVGGRIVEMSGREYMVRGRGYLKSLADIEEIVLRADQGTPIRVRDVARVAMGPAPRRGVADLDGQGDVVGGIVVMRQGENALAVIERVKAKLSELKASLPEGVEVVTTYDRSDLITKAIDTVTHKLIEEMLIVSLIILIFLWHFPSASIPIVTIPLSVALAFIPMKLLGINANLMSLSGIAISIGVLVDGAIVEIENAYNKTHQWLAGGQKGDFHKVRLGALLEVGPGVFYSLLVVAVAFLPVFTLLDQEGKLFRPLAYSKTIAMAIAALLAITLDPALRMLLSRFEPFHFRARALAKIASALLVGKYRSEESHPISRFMHRLYERPCRFVVAHPKATIGVAALLVASAIPVYLALGSEFMPPLREGTILYMPSAVQPGMSVAEAQRALQVQDKILMTFPEVERVFGKAGRADTSTDPAPFTMMETTILLKPESQWTEQKRWYSEWAPHTLKSILRAFWSDRPTEAELENKFNSALQLPGISNAWTMPIKGRLDMLSSGVRTPVGIKVLGSNLATIERVAQEVEAVVGGVAGTRSAYAERIAGGTYLDFVLRRDELARYGLSVDDANSTIMVAIGGENATRTVEGRERYDVNVRYARDRRDSIEALGRVLVALPNGRGQIPLSAIADLVIARGPSMLRDENGLLAAYVYVDLDTSKVDVGSYVARARRAVASQVRLPAGTSVVWSGQYENMVRVRERLKLILPFTLVLIFVLLYLNSRSAIKATIVLLAVPFSAVGAVWLLWLLGYHISIAVWVGLIALMGLDAETGIFMLLFLDLSHAEAKKSGHLRTRGDLVEAVIHGAVKRVRPKAMTVSAAMLGLLPIMWSTGIGSDLMKRIAAPMVGGLATSFVMELLVYPAIYFLWKSRGLPEGPPTSPAIV